MLKFTVTTSRLYNVNVKLHWGVQWITVPWCYKEPSPPIHHAWTLALFMFQRITLTQQHWHFFCLYFARSRNWDCETHRRTLKLIIRSENRHSNQIIVLDKAASKRIVRMWWNISGKFNPPSPNPIPSTACISLVWQRHLEEVLL